MSNPTAASSGPRRPPAKATQQHPAGVARGGDSYTRPHGVRHLLAVYDLGRDRLYGHVKVRKGRTEFLTFCRYLRSRYPPDVRIAIVLDDFSPHLSTRKDERVSEWAEANNVEFAYLPFYASWLNRIEASRRYGMMFRPDPGALAGARPRRRGALAALRPSAEAARPSVGMSHEDGDCGAWALTIQGVPNRSTHMPNFGEKNV